MCVPADAQPPALAGLEERPPGRRTFVMSADGTPVAAYEATAPKPSGAAVVILPDVRGLFPFYEMLTEGFAGAGLDAIAIDYFARTSDIAERGADWEYWAHVDATTSEKVSQDVAAAVARLRSTSSADRIYTVGFCFGGAHSFGQAAVGHGLAGVIGFYGSPVPRRQNVTAPMDLVESFECPVLGLFGGADEGIPQSQIDDFDRALTSAGVSHELHVYPGAPHSFFDPTYDDYAAECADAWQRVLTFTANPSL